jgi:hypothetical protein
MALSELSQGCSNKSDTVMINKNVTRLTTQGCNNTAISWLYRTCWNNLATSLIISTRLLQIVNSFSQTCWQLVTSSAKTTCWRLVDKLVTRCEIFACVYNKCQSGCILASRESHKIRLPLGNSSGWLILCYRPWNNKIVQFRSKLWSFSSLFCFLWNLAYTVI